MTSSTAPTAQDPVSGRALITGSAAPFAQRLVTRLEALGWEVETLVHTDPGPAAPSHSIHLLEPVTTALAAAVPDVDAVILLSGIDSLTSMVDDSRDLDTILGGLKPGSALVEVTTMAVFGDTVGDQAVSERDTPEVPDELDPVAACEIRVMACEDWLRSIVVRPGLVYGAGGGVALTHAIELARTHGASRHFGDGSEILPTVHEDDLLDLLAIVVTDPSARGIYHAVSGSVTTQELAQAVARAADVGTVEMWTSEDLQAEFGTSRQPPRISVRTDGGPGRAGAELGWRPGADPVAQALTR